MSRHPLETVINQADGFVLIGHSGEQRFPAFSYHQYTKQKKRFYCLDLGGLTESRGGTKGGKVYTSVAELPADHDDLAIIWVHPHTAARAVDVAHEAGCKRVWFSFKTGHPSAVARARELGMEVVEVGRCPIYYLDDKTPACKAHTLMVKATGLYGQPPRTDAAPKRREMM
ncbi:MAG: CoA-binding protein [Myxococcales bacterium]|nr:CoA-binding protein [Myxococcales bacterium]MCB9735951.1 CoA-binding protein [Deltaproteobacteria bacterium]